MKQNESIVKCGIRVFKECIFNPCLLMAKLSETCLTYWISDKKFLEICYKAYIGKKLDWNNPTGFNEKLQWLKLNDVRDEYTMMADKYTAKEIALNKIGRDICVPTLAVFDSVEEIDLDRLPDSFVLKTTHDSGGVVICKSKGIFDFVGAKKKLKKHLKRKYYLHGRELIYKNVKPRIIAEKYIDDGNINGLCDYKIMCFNGEPKCIFTCTERQSNDLRVTFFDLDWNMFPFERHYKKSDVAIARPKNLDKMIESAKLLSRDTKFLRVDFYEVDKELYLGEMTFYPGNGFEEFDPVEWDDILGSWLQL